MTTTSIFIVPRKSTAWKGNEAGWITASGWAAAGEQIWGEALVATTDGVFRPQESRLFPKDGTRRQGTSSRFRFRWVIPEVIVTAYKDLQLKLSKPQVWPIENEQLYVNKKVVLVWERHDLFPGPGRKLADKFKVPLVISVEAPVVWEARMWGVKRPLWGKWLESRFEAQSLKRADLVLCVSDEVSRKVIEMGVPPQRVVVVHNQVDSSLFFPGIDGKSIAHKYNLAGKRVIGWTGSFRAFHGLDTVVGAFKIVRTRYHDVVLVLVGDGQEFENIKKLINEFDLADSVILPGKQPFTLIPQFISNFYIALASAASAERFHYSPLKLREYLAVGCAVIAPDAGDLPLLFKANDDLLFYEPGNHTDLAEKMIKLLENKSYHDYLVNQATKLSERGTWLHELKRISTLLNIPT